LVTQSHRILAMWRKQFSQLFNVNKVKNVVKTEIHTAEPLGLEPSAFEVESDIEKLKGTNNQVLIKSYHKCLRQEREQFVKIP